MVTVNVCALDDAARCRAEELAHRLALPLQTPAMAWPEVVLRVSSDQGLELWQPGSREKPVRADFLSPRAEYRRTRGGGRKQALARAAGLHHGDTPGIIDATGGLGRDAFVLAGLGCEVTLVERHPVIAELLADALERACKDTGPAAQAAHRMHLVHDNAITWLTAQTPPAADIIYLDPMYPPRAKSALPGREMRLLQKLAGPDTDTRELLETAITRAGRRVILKRPRHATTGTLAQPDVVLPGKSTRFDIYLVH